MLVLDHVEAFDRAVAPARRHHRNLALERHEGFEDLRLPAELVEHRAGSPPSRIMIWPLPS